ncbi:hypothetical protein EV426DRAFT_703088 [Tirmania nivea]|nr:hypothetical protein EV426DRAFT_703088 [Tirmania nivea]
MAMNTAQIIAAVLLGVFSSLFIFCLVVSQVRQRLKAKKKHRNWVARYQGRAQQRLENKRRIWAMFGLTYNGTIDDVRQSDDEDDADVGEPKYYEHLPAAAYVECASGPSPYAQLPPPPYTAGTAGVGGHRFGPFSPPQRPERFHDSRRDEDMNRKIVSPRPQRHFQLSAPELVASGPLCRSDTIRSMRRCPTPPASRVAPESSPFDNNQSNTESSIFLEPPVSPRRLDSISKRRNDEG